MTEKEWLECVDPDKLLWAPQLRNKISERKQRLFACACCRRMWNLLTDDRSRAIVQIAEEYSDGNATRSELDTAYEAARRAVAVPIVSFKSVMGTITNYTPASVACGAGTTGPRFSSRPTTLLAAVIAETLAGDRSAHGEERKEQAAIFRDLIGNPFRPVTLDPRWLSSTVLDLARTIYDERVFERMPILGDALMDAGCDNEEIIEHCQGLGPHTRGCWVIDLLLGKG